MSRMGFPVATGQPSMPPPGLRSMSPPGMCSSPFFKTEGFTSVTPARQNLDNSIQLNAFNKRPPSAEERSMPIPSGTQPASAFESFEAGPSQLGAHSNPYSQTLGSFEHQSAKRLSTDGRTSSNPSLKASPTNSSHNLRPLPSGDNSAFGMHACMQLCKQLT